MALQFVGGLTTGFNGVTPTGSTVTVSLANLTGGLAASPSIGDVVFVSYAANSNIDRRSEMSIATGDGFTYTQVSSLYSGSASTAQTSLRLAYRRLTTTDTSLVLGNISAATAAGLTVSVHVWRGVHPTTPIDTTPITGTFGSGAATPNISFSSIYPITVGSVVLVAGAGGGTSVLYTSSGLSNFRTVRQVNTYQSVNGIGSYLWTSGIFTPANWTGGSSGYVNGSYAWVMVAIRPDNGAQTLSPSLFNNTQAFPSQSVSLGQISLQPAPLNNGQSFLNQIVLSKITLSPVLVNNNQVFFNHAVVPGIVALTPTLLNSSTSLIPPSLTKNVLELIPGKIDNGQVFYGASVNCGSINLTTNLVSNNSLFFAPSLAFVPTSLKPALLIGSQTFYSAVVSAGPITLAAPQITNIQTFYSAIGVASVLIKPIRLDNNSAIYAPALIKSAALLSPTLIVNHQEIYGPSIIPGGRALLPEQLSSVKAIFAPTVQVGLVSVAPELLTNTQAFSNVFVVPGLVSLMPLTFNQSEKFYLVDLKKRISIHFGKIHVHVSVDQITGSALVSSIMARLDTSL